LKKHMSMAPRIPKPKVKGTSIEAAAASAGGLLPVSQILDGPEAGRPYPGIPVRHSVSYGSLASLGGGFSKRVEFFGSAAEEREVCYVVDCSGSMKGVFGGVRRKLKESVEKLEADQYFYIIFFGDDRLFEFGGGRLVRATKEAKSAGYDFVDLIEPVGQTNALAALERAVQIRDGQGRSPSIIYFLTDGFELSPREGHMFCRRVEDFRKRFAPATRINTIGFWPQSADRKVLEAIAAQSGGEFSVVAESDN
jgi:hypothetical protein